MKNLKNILFVSAILTVSLISCKKKTEEVDGETPPASTLSIGDCGTFFDSGEYSGLCFVASGQPKDSLYNSMETGGTKSCGYILFSPGSYDPEVEVNLLESGTSSTATITMEAYKSQYESHSTISDLGDEAIKVTDEEEDIISNVLFIVRINNIIIQMGTDLDYCSHSDSQMRQLAEAIIANL